MSASSLYLLEIGNSQGATNVGDFTLLVTTAWCTRVGNSGREGSLPVSRRNQSKKALQRQLVAYYFCIEHGLMAVNTVNLRGVVVTLSYTGTAQLYWDRDIEAYASASSCKLVHCRVSRSSKYRSASVIRLLPVKFFFFN